MGKDINGKELGNGIMQIKSGKAKGKYSGRYIDIKGNRQEIRDWDLRELKNKLSKLTAEVTLGVSLADTKITMDKWFEIWDEVYKIPHVQPSTRVVYHHIYKQHIQKHIGKKKLSEIGKIQCQKILNELHNKYAWSVQDTVKRVLVDLFNRALEEQLVKLNPARSCRCPNNKPDDERRVLTNWEQEMFFEITAGTWYYNMFVVAVSTGLRAGEIFALTEDCIDFDKMEIDVRHTLSYSKYLDDEERTFHLEPPKHNSYRKVPITSKECYDALKKQIKQKSLVTLKHKYKNIEIPFSDRLFVTKNNTPMNVQNYNDTINKFLLEANSMLDEVEQIQKFSSHTFRHTFGTNCINDGVNFKTLQKWMGHKSVELTMNLYSHVTEDLIEQDLVKVTGLKTKTKLITMDKVVEFTKYNNAVEMKKEAMR
jgi:integrase